MLSKMTEEVEPGLSRNIMNSMLETTSSASGMNSSIVSDNSVDPAILKYYLQDEMLSIECVGAEIVWGCVKPGKIVSQDFTIRNRVAQQVRLQAYIEGINFEFSKNNNESVTTLALTLENYESRTISLNFSPVYKGAAFAKLIFIQTDGKRQVVSLYGYGGYSSVNINNVSKNPNGNIWLSFGQLHSQEMVQRSFELRNFGSLAAFVYLKAKCKGFDSNITVSPQEIVIEPNKKVNVTVTFTPHRNDFQNIERVNVFEVGTIEVISGPESTRGRIRRLYKIFQQQGAVPKFLQPFKLSTVLLTFPNERMPGDLLVCQESVSGMRDLLWDLSVSEMSLTVEFDLEQTGYPSVFGTENSYEIQSLCDETAPSAYIESLE